MLFPSVCSSFPTELTKNDVIVRLRFLFLCVSPLNLDPGKKAFTVMVVHAAQLPGTPELQGEFGLATKGGLDRIEGTDCDGCGAGIWKADSATFTVVFGSARRSVSTSMQKLFKDLKLS